MDTFASKAEYVGLIVIAGVVTAVIVTYLEHKWYDDTDTSEELGTSEELAQG